MPIIVNPSKPSIFIKSIEQSGTNLSPIIKAASYFPPFLIPSTNSANYNSTSVLKVNPLYTLQSIEKLTDVVIDEKIDGAGIFYSSEDNKYHIKLQEIIIDGGTF